MKKILVFITIVAMVMGGYFYKKQSAVIISSLVLENVEALANYESGGNVFCIGVGSVDCPINHSKVYAYRDWYSLLH